ncbi:hypothetical protein [Stagnihabitans tardus]|nr:hypothetical protein [Stagnihabitans tardus]
MARARVRIDQSWNRVVSFSGANRATMVAIETTSRKTPLVEIA